MKSKKNQHVIPADDKWAVKGGKQFPPDQDHKDKKGSGRTCKKNRKK